MQASALAHGVGSGVGSTVSVGSGSGSSVGSAVGSGAGGGAGAGAIDYTREHVDGGPAREPITERQVTAGKEVNRVRNKIGAHGFELVTMIAGRRQSLHDLYSTRRERDTASDMLRVYLSQMAEMWGFAGRAV